MPFYFDKPTTSIGKTGVVLAGPSFYFPRPIKDWHFETTFHFNDPDMPWQFRYTFHFPDTIVLQYCIFSNRRLMEAPDRLTNIRQQYASINQWTHSNSAPVSNELVVRIGSGRRMTNYIRQETKRHTAYMDNQPQNLLALGVPS